jgi:DNA-binding CsgD family transcriptional regulator
MGMTSQRQSVTLPIGGCNSGNRPQAHPPIPAPTCIDRERVLDSAVQKRHDRYSVLHFQDGGITMARKPSSNDAFDGGLQGGEVNLARPARRAAPPTENLTPRDLDVLVAIRRGSTSGAIAKSLGISLSTVRRHVWNILVKLDDRAQVAGPDLTLAAVPVRNRHAN